MQAAIIARITAGHRIHMHVKYRHSHPSPYTQTRPASAWNLPRQTQPKSQSPKCQPCRQLYLQTTLSHPAKKTDNAAKQHEHQGSSGNHGQNKLDNRIASEIAGLRTRSGSGMGPGSGLGSQFRCGACIRPKPPRSQSCIEKGKHVKL